jgi:glycosyltransferase involved in cell wall biosynthesis
MHVVVAIPTYKNFGKTIGYTLDALTKQTFKGFELLIIYKPFMGDNTLDIIEKYEKKLDIKIIIQKEGLFDEALNIIYSRSNGDILILLDDDTIPNNTFVEEHLRLHENYPDIGVIGGYVDPMRNTGFRKRFHNLLFEYITGYRKPLVNSLDKIYNSYPNRLGFLYFNEPPYRVGEIRYTFWIEGVNMSVKRRIYRDFRLPCSTIYGSGNELLLGIHSFKKGYHVVRSSCCYVKHLERESLSRTKNLYKFYEWFLDGLSLPFNIAGMGSWRNRVRDSLKQYYNLLRYIVKTHHLFRKRLGPLMFSHYIGLPGIIKAIEENVEAGKVRSYIKCLIGSFRKCINIYGLNKCVYKVELFNRECSLL